MPKIYRKLPPSSVDPKQKIGKADARYEEIFGAAKIGAVPSQDYRSFYPTVDEHQVYGDCLTFAYENTLETICKKLGIKDDDGNEFNLSEIDLAVGSGTSQQGNSFNNVAERARKMGIVLDRFAPYTKNWADRIRVFTAIPKTAKRYGIGTGHAWVKTDRDSLKNAMQTGPLWIALGLGETYSTKAGTEQDPITPPRSVSVYHSVLDGFIYADNKISTLDSYQRSRVIYSADYPVMYAKLLDPRGLPTGWQTQTNEGERIYERVKGKGVLRVEANGELHYVYPDQKKMEYYNLSLILPQFWRDQLIEVLTKAGKIIGITEEKFSLLQGYINS